MRREPPAPQHGYRLASIACLLIGAATGALFVVNVNAVSATGARWTPFPPGERRRSPFERRRRELATRPTS